MARNVRNFWVESWIDGRTTGLAGGPRNADGGFSLRVSIRDSGCIRPKVLEVLGTAGLDGTLRLLVLGEDGDIVHEVEATR